MSLDQHPSMILPQDSRHQSEPSALALKLAYAGLLPFLGGVLFVWLLAGRIEAAPFIFVVRGFTAYAALSVSFLGGLLWGLVVRSDTAGEMRLPGHARAVWAAAAYELGALVSLLMPPHAGLVVSGTLLIMCYLIDRKRYPELGAAGWLTLRFRFTAVASLSCFLVAAQI